MTTKQAPTKKAPVKKSVPVRAAPAKAAKAAVNGKPVKYSLVDLRDDVVARLPLVSKGTAEKVILTVFKAMTEAFLGGKSVNIKDFGRIEIKHRPQRQGRNPATGAAITIPAKTVPKFTFAKTLKEGAK
jgi:DNA-binding protein HU-beta